DLHADQARHRGSSPRSQALGGERSLSESALKERIKQLEEQVLRSQKLALAGQVAGGLTHDFNNLLTAILGFSGELLTRETLSVGCQEILGQIQQAGQRASNLARQLLTFTRPQAANAQLLNLSIVVENLRSLLRRAGGGGTLDLNLDTNLWPVCGDVGQLEQVLVNLAINARDAMPSGGRLTVETWN